MPTELPRILLRLAYENAARAYLESLPPEHFMEATAQATQREITLESLSLLRARRSDFHLFNELLVQYRMPRSTRPGQVVPDNMVALHEGTIDAKGSYDVPFQPVGPFLVLEYVSSGNRRKDYEDSFVKYERHLKVPYYLLFYPDNQEITLYRHNGRKFVTVLPNEPGRLAIPQLELETAILDGWVRYWHRGELLPLPVELQRDLNEARQQLAEANRRLERAEQELTRLRARLEQSQGQNPDQS